MNMLVDRNVEPETFHCDYCRAKLRNGIKRYYMMRFCSDGCITAYRRRLTSATAHKVQVLHASGLTGVPIAERRDIQPQAGSRPTGSVRRPGLLRPAAA
jgi:hypothetical protein